MLIYKIRQKSTGLYQGHGSSPTWTKEGKSWTRKQNALTLMFYMSNAPRLAAQFGINNMSDIELVTYEIVERSAEPVSDLIN